MDCFGEEHQHILEQLIRTTLEADKMNVYHMLPII